MFFQSFPFDTDGPQRMGSGKARRSQKQVDNTKFYRSLELTKDATPNDIKKAYKRLAVKHHPDKKGDPEKFKEICRAYEVLSDPEKRKIYDELGEEGLEGGAAADPTDIFDIFFGGTGRRSKTGKKKGEDVVSSLKVTYEQIYNGSTRKLAINKDVICNVCDGAGGPQEAIESCTVCNGQGIRIQVRQVGPMIQQTQSMCSVCRGQGKSIPENKKCKKCSGNTTVKERKILEIYVEKGVPNRHKIVISGEADQKVGEIPGDVVFVVEEQKHDVFSRNGADLMMTKNITLYEALTGFQFSMKHLDNRELIIRNESGQITRPNDIKCVEGEGMPTYKNPFIKGNLLITFIVDFPSPTQLDSHARSMLEKTLPKPKPLEVNEDDPDLELHYVKDFDESEARKASQKEVYEEDDSNEGATQQGVQCRQQ